MTETKHRVRRVRGALLIAVMMMTLLPATAASAAWDGCGTSNVYCVYKNDGGASGGVKQFTGNDSNYADNNFSNCTLNCGVNDNVSSMWNKQSYTVKTFVDKNYGGIGLDVGAGAKRSSLTSAYNDKLSSHCKKSLSTCPS